MNIQLADETVTTDRGVPAILWTLVCAWCGEECWWVDAARAENASLKALLLEARDYIADETGGAYADDLEFAAKIDAALGPADG